MIHFRTYGSSGPTVFLVHGGPAAPGYMAPIGRALADAFRLIEPMQRQKDPHPLTVARHIEDMHQVAEATCPDEKPVILGHSWGGLLTLAYAEAHPDRISAIVLVGCGTSTLDARNVLQANTKARTTPEMKERMDRLEHEFTDKNRLHAARGRLFQQIQSYELLPHEKEKERIANDAKSGIESWDDMVRLQKEGRYPISFTKIKVPVIMLHGKEDPHPGKMIRESFLPYMPQLEYHEWERCGHYPWLEKYARDDFYTYLRDWVIRHT